MAVINEHMKDLPISCRDCLYSNFDVESYDHYLYCCAMPEGDIIDDGLYEKHRPYWCPLKEV